MGCELVLKIYELTKKLPEKEKGNFIQQMERASTSIPANIAEGCASKFDKNYYSHLSIAYASLKELETYIILGYNLKYFRDEDFNVVYALADRLGIKISFLMKKIDERINKKNKTLILPHS